MAEDLNSNKELCEENIIPAANMESEIRSLEDYTQIIAEENRNNETENNMEISEDGIYTFKRGREDLAENDDNWQPAKRKPRKRYLEDIQIINDLFALFYADEVDFEIVHEGLEFLHEETDYSVIYAALRGLNKLRYTYLGTTTLDVIKESQVNLLDSLITNIGYDIKASEGTVAQRNRMQVLEYACMIGHQGCIDHALDLFRGLRVNGTEISPSLRPVAYCAGLRYGNGEDFEFLWDRMVATNTANEMTIIGSALGCTTDQDKLKKYLVSMQVENSPIRTQDLTVPLVSVLSDYNNVGLVLDELKNGYEQWNTIYTTMDSVVSTIGSSLHTEEEFEKFTNWLSSCTQCTEQVLASAGKALGKAKSVAGWARGHQEEILRVLRNNAILKTPSATLLALSFVVIWLKF